MPRPLAWWDTSSICVGRSEKLGRHQGNIVRQGRDACRFQRDLAWRCRFHGHGCRRRRSLEGRQAAGGGRLRFRQRRFKPDSIFASGTNLDVVELWFPRLSDEDQMLAVARFNEITSVQGSTMAVALPGIVETLSGPAQEILPAWRRHQRFDQRRGKDAGDARRRPAVRRRLWLRRGRQSEAGARHHPGLLRPHRPAAIGRSPWSATTATISKWRGPAAAGWRSACSPAPAPANRWPGLPTSSWIRLPICRTFCRLRVKETV